MARTKADYDGLIVQEWLTKAQAMAYVNERDETKFREKYGAHVNCYNGGDYYLPELRARKMNLPKVHEASKYE